MKRKFLALLLAFSMAMALGGTALADISRTRTYTLGQYSDVADDAWYAASVKNAFELGLMSGNSATTFHPTGTFTLAEAATIAARMHNLYHGGDGVLAASSPWYQSAVNYCINHGIFGLDDFDDFTCNATRAEMAGMIAAALPEEAWTPINSVGKLPDVSRETPYQEAITQLYNAGVFSGSDEYGMFHPYAFITRAEVAAIVARCADPSLRVTLNLTPASQRPAVILPGEPTIGGMSHERIEFAGPWVQIGNTTTRNNGLADANGNVVIPTGQYTSIGPCNDHGLTKVIRQTADGYSLESNLIDMNGNIQFNEWFSGLQELKHQQYEVARAAQVKNGSRFAHGVIDRYGNIIVPLNKGYTGEEIYQVGNCFVARTSENSYTHDIYNSAGQLILSCETNQLKYDVSGENNNPLMAVKKGEKWAVMYNGNYVTDAVYTDIILAPDGAWATGYYGSQKCLIGRYGVVSGAELGTEFIDLLVESDNSVYLEMGQWQYIHFTPFGRISDVLTYDAWHSPISGESENAVLEEDGWDSLFNDEGELNYFPQEKLKSEYWIGGENSMPVLYYGPKDRDDKPQEVVIGKFQGSFYYDEIRPLGEGYYGCRFNETWYLVHS